jgi:hypothetical protein
MNIAIDPVSTHSDTDEGETGGDTPEAGEV